MRATQVELAVQRRELLLLSGGIHRDCAADGVVDEGGVHYRARRSELDDEACCGILSGFSKVVCQAPGVAGSRPTRSVR